MTEQQNKTNCGKTGCRRLCAFGVLVATFFVACTAMWLIHIHDMTVKCEGDTFDARCEEFDTGKDLKAGLVYQVSIKTDNPWFDSCVEATPEGFGVKKYPVRLPGHCDADYKSVETKCDADPETEKCEEKRMLTERDGIEGRVIFKLSGPLRRSPQYPWFQLIGRVGDGPILPIEWESIPSTEKEQTTPSIVRTATIAPNRDGRLKLFVNDVDLIFLPWGRWFFYGNNQGTGTVKVDVVKHKETGK